MPTITATDMTGTAPIAPVVEAPKQLDTSGGTQAPQEATGPNQEAALNSKMAILARNQQRLRQQQRMLEEQRKTFEAERKEIEQVKTWKERIKVDPYGVLLEQGLTADQVASLMLNQPNPMDQNMLLLKQQLDQAQEKIKGLETRQEQNHDAGRDAARKQILHDVKQVIAADDSFEAIKNYGDDAAQAVVSLIEATFDKDGFVMNTDDAIKEVEDYLIDEALKVARLKKVQSRLYPANAAPSVASSKKQLVPPRSPIQTLSNRMVPSTIQPSSDKARRERAILAFEGKN